MLIALTSLALFISSGSLIMSDSELANSQVAPLLADTSFVVSNPFPTKPSHQGICPMSQINVLHAANALAQLSLPLIDASTLSTRGKSPAPSIDAVQNLKDTVTISLDARAAASKQNAPLA
jgi:hypothetical protein